MRRVLIVEDSPADAALVQRFLDREEDQPYAVLVATSGEHGLDLCRTERPDVVLLDFDLPDSDGLEFLDELGGMSGESPVVLAITGQSDPRVAAELIRRGAIDYIAKSDLSEESVRLAVRQAVRTRALRDDLQRRTREREASRAELVASLERASFLASVSELLTRSLDAAEVLDTVAELAVPHVADACFVDVLEDGTLTRATIAISPALRKRLSSEIPRTAPSLDGTEGVGAAIRSSASATYTRGWLHAVARWDDGVAALERDGAIGSLIVAPLLFDGKPLGAITLASMRSPQPHVQGVAEEIARRTSAALANARAFEAQRAAIQASESARRRINIVSRVSAVFARSLDWRDTMTAVVDLLVAAFCDVATVALAGDDGADVVASSSHSEALRSAMADAFAAIPPGARDEAGIGATLRYGTSEFYPDANPSFAARFAAAPHVREAVADLGLTTYISVPIPGAGGTVAGAFALAGTGKRRFTVDDLAVAEDLGRRAGMYLENARSFERQREIARTLQTSLLPAQLPAVEGVELAAQCVAGAEGLEVGGDWYDVAVLPRGRVAFAVGDVAGRGLLAAATMGQLRSSLRAYVLEGLEPSDALARLNGFVLSQERMEFATVALGVLDTASGVLSIASAGHLPPLLVEPNGEARLVGTVSALPVGLIADAAYEQSVHRLSPGSVLCLYTDGLVESRTRGIDDGLTALVSLAAGEAGPPETLVAKLLGRLGGGAGDDVTVLALRYAAARTGAAQSDADAAIGVTYPAVPQSARAARHRLRAYVESLGFDEDRVSDALLAAGEAIANAVEHAYAGGIHPGIFSVRGYLAGGATVIEVLDHGLWRRRGADVVPLYPLLSERGRGLVLMHALADQVDIEHDETGTRVRLSFALPRAGERDEERTTA